MVLRFNKPYRRIQLPADTEWAWEEFMSQNGNNYKAESLRQKQQNPFSVTEMTHCVACDLDMSKGIAAIFRKKFGHLDELKVRTCLLIDDKKKTNEWQIHLQWYVGHLRKKLQERHKIAVSIITWTAVNWRIGHNMLKVLFRFTSVQTLVFSWNPRQGIQEKRTHCYCDQILQCVKSKTVLVATNRDLHFGAKHH